MKKAIAPRAVLVVAGTLAADELEKQRAEHTATRRHAQHVGRNIRAIRRQRGLTQERLSLMLDLRRRNTVSNWERGVHAPDAAHLERLAAVLEVHWTDFYRRDDGGSD